MMVAGVILAVRALRSFMKVRMVKQIKEQKEAMMVTNMRPRGLTLYVDDI